MSVGLDRLWLDTLVFTLVCLFAPLAISVAVGLVFLVFLAVDTDPLVALGFFVIYPFHTLLCPAVAVVAVRAVVVVQVIPRAQLVALETLNALAVIRGQVAERAISSHLVVL